MLRLVLLAVLAAPLFAGPREVDKAPRIEGRAVILRPVAALTEADERELAQKGIDVQDVLPGGRYLARMRAGAIADDARIVAIEPLTAEKKLHPSAIRVAAKGLTMAGVHVVFHRDVPFEEAREAILAAGGTLDVFTLKYLPSQRIEAKIPPSALRALAEDERVLTIAGQRHLKIAADNATTAQLSDVTPLYGAPYGLTGDGVVVSLFELAAAQNTHVEFGGRLTVEASGGTGADRRHATHVAGTIGAAGLNPAAKGMAPKSRIFQFCVRAPGANTCTGNWLSIKDEQLATRGVMVDNNSWGYIWGWEEGAPPIWNQQDEYWGAYDVTLAAPIDEISIDRGVLFVHSAGNDGNLPFGLATQWRSHIHWDPTTGDNVPGTYCISNDGTGSDCPTATCTACELTMHHPQTPFDTLGTTAAAKNVLAVGAVNTDLSIIGFSSRGPAKDGRIKPDVVARGSNVFSTVPENSYANLNGTSMSAPAVTGIAALLTEQWRRTFAGANPRPEQLKAVIIAGTEDLGNPGPDYTFGYGLVNAKNSADLIRDDAGSGNRIRNFVFNQGATDVAEMTVVVEQPQTLRAVLTWPDPPTYLAGADDIAEKALVNNIDLYVVDPSGNTWQPWVLNRNDVQANATRAVNAVDNVEMVEIPNAAPGVYRILAAARSIMDGPQPATVVTNVRTARPCFDVHELESGNNGADRATVIAAGTKVFGGLCDQADVDFYTFTATQTGTVSVTVTAGETPLRATLTGDGISRTQDIAANTTAVLSADVNVAPNRITLKIEANGPLSAEPQYSFTPEFPEQRKPKRRAARG